MKPTLILLLCLPFFSLSQEVRPIENKAIHFQIPDSKYTIDFILADSTLNETKPIFLFCQGSQPIPLFINFGDNDLFMAGGGISNFDLNTIRLHYHLIVISMPKTPVILHQKSLNANMNYVTKEGIPFNEFLETDYLENYVTRAKKVLGYLKKQSWVDNSKLVIAGHSQGTKIAIRLAKEMKSTTYLGLFSPNVYGRIDQLIRQSRKDAELQKITWEQADIETQNNFEFYKMAANKDSIKNHPELKSWESFSKTSINDLTSLKIPIYLNYGSEDISAELCDLVPLEFIRKKKDNLTFKREAGLEHNFFEVSQEGKTNYKKPHWPSVMNNFIQWTLLE